MVQAWDFVPGGNFVLAMHEAARRSKRVIMVCSPEYLDRPFTKPEWAAIWRLGPEGTEASVVPVIVRSCRPEGLLGPIVWIDLVGLDQDAAREALLKGVRIKPGDRPTDMPPFPGPIASGSAPPGGALWTVDTARPEPPFPAGLPTAEPKREITAARGTALGWELIDGEPPVVSRARDLLSAGTRPEDEPGIELHLVPERIPSPVTDQDFAELRFTLIESGRRHALFGPAAVVDVRLKPDFIVAATASTSHSVSSGLAVTRTGQRSVWGGTSVFSHTELTTPGEALRETISDLLAALLSLRSPVSDRVAFALGIAMTTADGRKVTAWLHPQRWIAYKTAAADQVGVAQWLAERLAARI